MVKIYTTKYCSYCQAAKRLLAERKVSYEEIDLNSLDGATVDQLLQRSGMKTVPQIFFGDKLIGGYTELAKLDRQDSLKSLLPES